MAVSNHLLQFAVIWYNLHMQTKLLNYRVIVEPEIYTNGDKVYNAYCPTLGITDYGDTIE
jgi:hypothetical protein